MRIAVGKALTRFRKPGQISDCSPPCIALAEAGTIVLQRLLLRGLVLQGTVISDDKHVGLAGSMAFNKNLRRLEFCNLKHGLTPW